MDIIRKPNAKPINPLDRSKDSLKRGMMQRRIVNLERTIEQEKKMNQPTAAEIKYRDKLKKDLEDFDIKHK